MTQPLADRAVNACAADLALAPVMAAREADWRIGPVVYQVLVDRFAPSADLDAKRALYPAPRTLHGWDETPVKGRHLEAEGLWTHELAFWGGDLASLRARLDHVEGLGVDVLYLNPIHQAHTNHKYDAQDYWTVSPEFGDRADVTALAGDLHGRGMRLVLDGVLNHMGRTSPLFQAAMASPDAPERDWFHIGPEWKLGYRAWWDVANLPDVNWESPAVRARLFADADSVIKGWLADGVDGWRLDVAYDIGFRHLWSLTQAAHAARPGSLVLGEVYNYPADWLGPLDAILNMTVSELMYGVARGTLPGPQAAAILERMVADCDYDGLLRCWLVLDNHDRPRLATVLPDAARRRIAMILQFTLPGAPHVYYGSELAMPGGEDPENRAPMRWDLVEAGCEELSFVRQLTALRRDCRALRIGEFRTLDTRTLLGFTRHTERLADLAVVLVNPTDEPVSEFIALRQSKLTNNEPLRDVFTGAQVRLAAGVIQITVPARTAFVLRPVTDFPGRDYDPYKRVL